MEQTTLQTRQVDFNGDMLLAAQDNDNRVWVAIKWVCNGLGMSQGQMQNERLKIHKDLVLRQGERDLVLPTNGSNQEVLCILIDYLPLWLAKISITPKMQKESPELVEKLIAYQLKAKDVLAAAFLPNHIADLQHNNPSNCIMLNNTIQALKSMQQSLIDCTMQQGYVLQDHEKQLEDLYEEVEMLGDSLKEQKEELKDEIQSHFDFLTGRVNRLKEDIGHHTLPLQATHRPTGKALAHSIIKPLAEARNDITRGYNCTYRLVYSEMGVSWSNRLSRYANKHKSKNKPSKINLLVSDSKLLNLFEETVNRLLVRE